jgi:trehalose 6-phosphate synthase/phosphatase
MKKVIIVANRLPITVQRGTSGLSFNPSAGGLATGLSSIYRQDDNVWIGWPGGINYTNHEERTITRKLKEDHMSPVFLNQVEIERYYEGYCNGKIWPLFHYFPEFADYEPSLWDDYVAVNKKFADAVLKLAGPDDIIWVQDYQLLLVPHMLREELPDATIGFFLHIPFPSFEIFRLSPWRRDLLQGMLGADLVGFHTYDDMRHFSSSVARTLGFSSKMGNIKYGHRLVAVDAFPMGIDYDKWSKAADLPEAKAKLEQYQEISEGVSLILSIDRLDYSKGIKHRLHAFDRFLSSYPEYIGKVSLVLLVVPSRTHVAQYQQLKEEIDTLVGKIDGKYSNMNWRPIHYFYRSMDFASLVALYELAEVAMITPIRDGMNLVCKEYIACRTDHKGVLILSEMAGAAKELGEAILINPNDESQLAEGIHRALTMPEEEQIRRMKAMRSTVERYDVHNWVGLFMKQLDVIKEKQKALDMKMITEKSSEELLEAYQNAEQRLLLLDYDGTLQGFFADPLDAAPDDELILILQSLCADPKNNVTIISGRDKKTLESWTKGLNLNLICEHGVWSRYEDQGWKTVDGIDGKWKPKVREILEMYVDRTPGSFIEDKDYSLVWHYRNADAEFGDLRARELVSNLNYLIQNMNLATMEGNKVIEIKSREINKGRTATKFLAKKPYDFVFACGDDTTDEDTFAAMPDDAFTIKVGVTGSQAKYNVENYKQIRSILKKMGASALK